MAEPMGLFEPYGPGRMGFCAGCPSEIRDLDSGQPRLSWRMV